MNFLAYLLGREMYFLETVMNIANRENFLSVVSNCFVVAYKKVGCITKEN